MPINDAARAASIATRKAQAAAHINTTLKIIEAAREGGASTDVAICIYLNSNGSRTSWGCMWTAHTVGYFLNHKATKFLK